MKSHRAIAVCLSATLFVTGCEFVTTNAPVDAKDQTFALNLIQDEGYRCQRITKISEKATVQGWRVTCFAQSYGTDNTDWPYEVTKMPGGWVVSSWKVNSELPRRCQANPDQACGAPG